MGHTLVELAPVYTKPAGGTKGDVSFPFDEDIEIVVDAAAGSAIFDARAQFKIGVIVRDLSDNTIIPTTAEFSGALGVGAWETASTQFTFTISSTNLGAAKDNHICEAIAYLQLGIATVDASFARSHLFIITAPQGKSELISSWILSINTENINDSRLNDVKAKLEEILLSYGAEKINISIEKGSVLIKFLAKFKRKSDRLKFENDLECIFDEIRKEFNEISSDSIDTIKAKYIYKAVLENEKLNDDIRTPEERELDKENKILKNELLKEEIKIKDLDQIEKFINIFVRAKNIGDIELEKQLAGSIKQVKESTDKATKKMRPT